MGFFSSGFKPYRYGKYGYHHYKRKGLLGRLLHSFSSWNHYRRYPHPIDVTPPPSPDRKTILCRHCQAHIPAGSKFCLQCGSKVETAASCTSCGQALPADAKFCPSCGAKAHE